MLTIFAAFPAKLRDILQDPSIIKAGVAILRESIFSFMDVRTPILYSEDCKKLWKDYEVNVSNCVELGLLARSADNPQWKGKYTAPIGLARLCEVYFGHTLAKGKVQRSNWEALLTQKQQQCE